MDSGEGVMIAILAFLAAIVAANFSVAYFGPASTPFNAFLLIGLNLSLRDHIHEKWHGQNLGLKMLGLICAGAAITYIFNRGAGMICLGSVVAFTAALAVDAVIYQGLFKKSRMVKMNRSNLGSAAVDSVLFPTIAFGVFLPWVIILQFAAKVGGGFIWSLWLNRCKHEWHSPNWDPVCKKCGKVNTGVYR